MEAVAHRFLPGHDEGDTPIPDLTLTGRPVLPTAAHRRLHAALECGEAARLGAIELSVSVAYNKLTLASR